MAHLPGRSSWTAAAVFAAAAAAVAATAASAASADAVDLGGAGRGSWSAALLRPSRRTLSPRDIARTYTLRRLVCPAGTHIDDGDESCDDTDDESPGSGGAARPHDDDRRRHASTRVCPSSLGFRSVDRRDGRLGGLAVAAAAMVEDEDGCTGDGKLVLLPPGALTSDDALTDALGDDADDKDLAVPLAKIVKTGLGAAVRQVFGDDTLVGVDSGDRSCGRRRSSEVVVTIVATVRKALNTAFIGRNVSLPAGAVLLRMRMPSWDDDDAGKVDSVMRHHDAAPAHHEDDDDGFHGKPLCVYTQAVAGEPGARGPNSTAGSDGGASCFPAAAMVELASGRAVSMADLAVGDMVRVAAGSGAAAFSPVYLFSHRTAGGSHPVVSLTTESGRTVTASPDHLLPVGGGDVIGHSGGRRVLVRAADIVVGDALTDAAAAVSSRVVSKTTGTAAGLYNPHTVAGDIVVEGILASTWTAAVPPAVAVAALAPAAAVGALTGYRVDPSGGILEGGGGSLGRALLRAVAWLSS
ncbi:hypothetical protein MMPV_005092 [Pyropia vietnamensis]